MEKRDKKTDLSGILYGVGVGPGEPELITQKAIQVIASCDIIILPSEPIEECYAFRIAEKMVPNIYQHQLIAMPFPMIRDKHLLQKAHHEIYQKIEQLLLQGKSVAFLTIGDPSIYATYMYIHKELKENGGNVQMISGVPSFCAVAAKLNISLGEMGELIHIIPGSYDVEKTIHLQGTQIYMKSGKKLTELIELLKKESKIRSLQVYSVSNCGLDNEKVAMKMEDIDLNSGYLTVVIVKEKKVC